MAFLDNSGDIILDAVLTDTGRKRLARGDGSFKISKFCLADDEINYGLYDKNNANGSAYYDLDILSTPVLEAFTNNTSSVKSKLVTISRTNLLYLPVIKLYKVAGTNSPQNIHNLHGIAVDDDTVTVLSSNGVMHAGFLNGVTPKDSDYQIRLDQGLDTTAISAQYSIDTDLLETQYIIEIDNRLGFLADVDENAGSLASPSFIDDDNIATYYITNSNQTWVQQMDIPDTNTGQPTSAVSGPRGTKLRFKIQTSTELNTSTYLFTSLGSALTFTPQGGASTDFYIIDTTVRVTGATTGYSIDVPIRYYKKQ